MLVVEIVLRLSLGQIALVLGLIYPLMDYLLSAK
nr:MAG TPA: hypothetical protein [Caudoviricetes sp.]